MRAVLLPALGEPPSSLDLLAQKLAAHEVTTAAVVARSGGSFLAHVAQAAEAVMSLRDDADLTVIIGASYGGMVAAASVAGLIAGGRNPTVISSRVMLMMLDSPHPLTYPAVRALVGSRADVTLPNPERVDLTQALHGMREACAPGSLADMPLLIVSRGPGTWPGVDPDMPAADRVWLAHQRLHALMSRRSSVAVLAGVGHAMATQSPGTVARIAAAWLTDAGRRCGQS